MKENFGFDEEVSKIIYEIASKTSSEEFFSIMGGICYGIPEEFSIKGYSGGMAFGIIADAPSIKKIRKKLKKLGLDDQDIETLIKEVTNQHNVCDKKDINDYTTALWDKKHAELPITEGNNGLPTQARTKEIFDAYGRKEENEIDTKIDFSHMCITIATILKENNHMIISTFPVFVAVPPVTSSPVYVTEEEVLGRIAWKFNETNDNLDDNAGYAGDVYGAFYANPSMGNDDYMADLDSVNIADMIKNSEGKGVINTFNNYYGEIHSGKINRAENFIKIKGEEEIFKELTDYIERQENEKIKKEEKLKNTSKDKSKEELEYEINKFSNNIKVAEAFKNSLEKRSNKLLIEQQKN